MKTWRMMLVVLAAAALAGSAYALTPAKVNGMIVGGTYDPAGKAPSVIYPSFLASPGESLDYTFYDYQHNGSVSRMIALDGVSPGGVHVTYMWSGEAGHNPRNAAYQFNDRAGGGWSGNLSANTSRAGYTTIAVFSDGRAACAFHQGTPTRSVVAIDAARGAGAFTVVDIDTVSMPGGDNPIWPHIMIGHNDHLNVAAKPNTTTEEMFRSHSTNGTTWSSWAGVSGQTTNLGTICQEVVSSMRSGKVAIVYNLSIDNQPNQQLNNNVWYIESNDHGATWGAPVNVTNFQTADTIRAYCDVSGIYDNSDNLHIAFTGNYWTGPTSIWNAAAIFHWSAGTGLDCVSGPGNVTGTWWWDQDSAMGGWKRGADRPSLSIDAAGNLYCVWTGQIVPTDIAANGFPNGDLYGAGSANGGNTWGTRVGLTESHTPGAGPGACDDDDYPSIAAVTTDSVRILYINDKDAGGSVQGEGATVPCPVKYLTRVKTAFVGVEAGPPSAKMPGSFELGAARPNPVGRMTEIAYALPVARTVNLAVYNAAGQLVKVLDSGSKAAGFHSARWDGGSVPAGVYFYRLSAGEFTQTRSMVVVR